MTTVQFLQGWRHYNGGERAGFTDGIANELVNGGLALKVDGSGNVVAGPTVDPAAAAVAADQQSDSSGDDPSVTLDETS